MAARRTGALLSELNSFLTTPAGKTALGEHGLVLVMQKPRKIGIFKGILKRDIFRTRRTGIGLTVWDKIKRNYRLRKEQEQAYWSAKESGLLEVGIARKSQPKKRIGVITTSGDALHVMHTQTGGQTPHGELKKFGDYLARHLQTSVTHSAI